MADVPMEIRPPKVAYKFRLKRGDKEFLEEVAEWLRETRGQPHVDLEIALEAVVREFFRRGQLKAVRDFRQWRQQKTDS